jgi:PKD repeat protein
LSEICFADSSSFITQNGNITTWDWDFGDGQTLSYDTYREDACHIYDGYGGATYQVTLTLTGQIGSDIYTSSITKSITISSTPEAMITVSNNCLNDTTYFMDVSDPHGEPINSWQWDLDTLNPGILTSTDQNPKHKYLQPGDYVARLVVTNEAGCTDSTTAEVSIYDLPLAAFHVEDTCQGYYTTFIDESQPTGAAISSWMWHFGDPYCNPVDSISYDPAPKHIYDITDEYTATLYIQDQNTCKDTATFTFKINPVPTALFTLTEDWEGRQGQVKLDNLSQGADTWFWDFDDTFTSTEESPVHQYLDDSDPVYILRLVAYNQFGCPDTLDYPYTLIFTGLYVPNAFSPSISNAEFRTFKPVGINLTEYKLEVFSSWGNLVYTSTLLENGQPAVGWDGTFEGQDMPTGTYIWRVTARFRDDSYWRGSDNGDGNTKTQGTVTLIR